MALAPLRALTGLSVRRGRAWLSRILPQGALALSMRLSHASLANNTAGANAAGAPAEAAGSA
eukprot:8648724-Pyramimonas_sp.AAC.1